MASGGEPKVLARTEHRHLPERLKGIVAMLIAVGFFAFMDALMKSLAAHYPPLQVAFLRGAAAVPFVLLPVLLRNRWHRLRPVNIRLHLARGVLAVIMLGGFIYSLKTLSLADAYSLFLCAPLLVTALSVPMLKEHVSRAQWVAIGVGLSGVLLMLRPTGENFATIGGLAAIVAAFAYALAVISVRALARTDTTESMVLTFSVLLAIAAGALAIPGWVTLDWSDWPWMIGVGITGAIGQHFITEAFRHAPASVIAPFEYTAMLWAIGLDVVFWGVLPGAVTLAGSAIVIGAGVYLIRRERQAAAA